MVARLTLTQEIVVQIHDPEPYMGLIQRYIHFSIHSGCYAPFPHGRRKMVGILSDQL